MNWFGQFIMKTYNLWMEYIKDFDNWNEKKKTLNDALSKAPYFKEREIWWLSIGVNVGYEEDGKSNAFSRPVLVIRKFNRNLFLGVPLSTRVKVSPFYIFIIFDNRPMAVMISQLRVFSSKRLLGEMGKLEDVYYQNILSRIRELFLSSSTNGQLAIGGGSRA